MGRRRNGARARSAPSARPSTARNGEPRAGAGPEIPDCVRCGACCFTDDPHYVEVFAVDWERMDANARSFVREEPATQAARAPVRRFMRIAGGRCAALGLHPASGLYLCRIYEQRGDVCRHSLEAGWGHCHEQRAAKRVIAVDALRASARGVEERASEMDPRDEERAEV